MPASARLLVDLLLLEQRRATPATYTDAGTVIGVPTEELPLVTAAAVLAAGEPKRAQAVLAGGPVDGDLGRSRGAA
jgi:hypothetical protein